MNNAGVAAAWEAPSRQHVPHNMTSAHVSGASSLTRESSGASPAVANEIKAFKS